MASTAKSYLAAVRHAQISLGLGDPCLGDMPQLEYVLKGLKRNSASVSLARLPITPVEMRILKQVCEKQGLTYDRAMLWAVACLCFFGFLRSGEAVAPSESCYDANMHMLVSDVRINSRSHPRMMEVAIKSSKWTCFEEE